MEEGLLLLVSLVYLLFRRALAVAALRFRSREFKELEIIVLRHELAVLRRQVFALVWRMPIVCFSLQPAGSSDEGRRSSCVQTPCCIGIASLFGDAGPMLGGGRVGRR